LNWDSLDRGSYAEPHQTVLLNRVKEVKIRFLDNQNAWQNDWPPPSQGELVTDSLPLAVELSVKLSDWGEIIRLFLLQGLSNHELKTP
jgi:general secretion pathway protein J